MVRHRPPSLAHARILRQFLVPAHPRAGDVADLNAIDALVASPASITVTGPVVALEDFSGANRASIVGRATPVGALTWVQLSTAATPIGITSGVGQLTSGTAGYALLNSGSNRAIGITISAVSTHTGADLILLLDYTVNNTDGNFIKIFRTGQVTYNEFTSGVVNQNAVEMIAAGGVIAGDTVYVRKTGNTVKCYLNSVLKSTKTNVNAHLNGYNGFGIEADDTREYRLSAFRVCA